MSRLYLELDGQVSIIERKGNKVISKDPIDGKIVLDLIVHALCEGLKYLPKTKSKKVK